jgi:hypothetical protein
LAAGFFRLVRDHDLIEVRMRWNRRLWLSCNRWLGGDSGLSVSLTVIVRKFEVIERIERIGH